MLKRMLQLFKNDNDRSRRTLQCVVGLPVFAHVKTCEVSGKENRAVLTCYFLCSSSFW